MYTTSSLPNVVTIRIDDICVGQSHPSRAWDSLQPSLLPVRGHIDGSRLCDVAFDLLS